MASKTILFLSIFTTLLSGCGDSCENSIVENSPPFPCLGLLGISAQPDADECEDALILSGQNDCDESLLFPASTCGNFDSDGPCEFAPGADIELMISSGDFRVIGPSRRNLEIPVDRGTTTGIYRFSVD